MSSFDTIKRAERYLGKLSQAYEKCNQQDIDDSLLTLLNCIKSISDHLLEDANQKFALDISPKIRLAGKFDDRAPPGKPQEFKTWFDAELKQIRKDSVCGFLINVRNIDTHRKSQGTTLITAVVNESVAADSGGQEENPTSSKVHFYFQGLEGINVLQASRIYLNSMKSLVNSAYEKFLR